MLVRLPYSWDIHKENNLWILNQLLGQISRKKRLWSIIPLLLCRYGIQRVKKSTNLLDMHFIEGLIAALCVMISQGKRHSSIYLNGKQASSRTLVKATETTFLSSWWAISAIKKMKDKCLRCKRKIGVKIMETSLISRLLPLTILSLMMLL